MLSDLVDVIQLENVLEFKYLGFVLDESGGHGAECCRKVARGRKVLGAIRSLVNGRSLQLESASVLHEALVVSVLLYDGETMVWREKESSRIRAQQMDNLKRFLGIRTTYSANVQVIAL